MRHKRHDCGMIAPALRVRARAGLQRQ